MRWRSLPSPRRLIALIRVLAFHPFG